MSDEGTMVKLVLESGEVFERQTSDAAAWNLMVSLWIRFDRPKLELQEEEGDRLKILLAD